MAKTARDVQASIANNMAFSRVIVTLLNDIPLNDMQERDLETSAVA